MAAASGDASGAQMLVSTYDLTGSPTGGWATISLVQPYAEVLAGQNNRAGLGAAVVLDRMASTPLGLTGAMAPTFAILDNLDAPALSNAVSQTLPVLAGAASQATYATQRALQQTVIGRLDDAYGLRTADAAAERHVWLKPLGGVTSQSGNDGAPGYVRTAAAWLRASMRRCRRGQCSAACFRTHIRTSRAAMRPCRTGSDWTPISSASMAPTR